MKYFWLFLFVFGCEINPYYTSFLQEMEKRGFEAKGYVWIDIVEKERMYNDNTLVMGDCTGNKITINKFEWDNLSDCERELLIYHELGHCLLKKGHNESPKDIMYKLLIEDCQYYTENREAVLDRLFYD